MTFPAAFTRRTLLLAVAALVGGAVAPASAKPAQTAPPVITVLGDSITAGLGLPAAQALPAQLKAALAAQGVTATVRGAGVSGDTTDGALARLDFSVQPDTAVCVVELGANDVLQSVPVARTTANLTAIATRLRRRGIAVVLMGGRAPARSTGAYGREFDAVFAAVARRTGAILVPDALKDIEGRAALKQADGLHPNAHGARLIAARTAPAVVRALKSQPLLGDH